MTTNRPSGDQIIEGLITIEFRFEIGPQYGVAAGETSVFPFLGA